MILPGIQNSGKHNKLKKHDLATSGAAALAARQVSWVCCFLLISVESLTSNITKYSKQRTAQINEKTWFGDGFVLVWWGSDPGLAGLAGLAGFA